MTLWPARAPFDLQLPGKRLWVLLLIVAAYYVAAGLVVQWFRVRAIDLGRAGSLINTLILGLLMGVRNREAGGRWWGGPRAVGPAHQRYPQPRRQVRRLRAGRRPGPLACRRDPGDLSRSP